MDFVHEQLSALRVKLDKYPLLCKAEDTTNVPKELLVVGAALCLVISIVLGLGMASVSLLVGFTYPALKTFQVMDKSSSSKTSAAGDETQWLVYWVLYSFLTVLETFSSFLLYWIPFYYTFKLAFLLWAMLPTTKGAKFLYDSFFKDFLKKSGSAASRIDAALADAKKQAGGMASEFASVGASDVAAAAAAVVPNEEETKKES